MTEPASGPRPRAARRRPPTRCRAASAFRGVAAAVALVLALSALPGDAGAQQIEGVALGPDGEALAEVPVALHRVGDGTGAFAGSTVTDDRGRFRFTIEAPDSALYFAAIRYDGRMYIGPPVTGATASVEGYELRADPEAEAGAVAGALSGAAAPRAMGAPAASMPQGAARGASGGDTGAFLLLALLALGTAAIFLTTAPGYRRRRTRDTLIALATVENRLAEGVEEGERARLEERRATLRERLAPRG